MSDWRIEKVQSGCSACKEPFADQQRVVSVVLVGVDEVPVRRDFCQSCFEEHKPGDVFWETRWVQEGEAPRKIDFNQLLRIFEAWVENPPPGQKELLYLIALLLIRKRFFRMLDLVSEGGEEYLRVRRPGPEQEPFLVPAPLLQSHQLPALTERLESLLDGSLGEDVQNAVV